FHGPFDADRRGGIAETWWCKCHPGDRTGKISSSPALMPATIAFVSTSASPRCLDGGDVELLHRHHRLEGTLCLIATSRKRVGQHARGDLPREAPAVLAPTALTFLAAIADDRVPVAVRLFLIVRRDLEGKGLAVSDIACLT